MLGVIIILIILTVVSLSSEIHGMGIWLLLMVTHNYVAEILGSSASHMPLFAGLIIIATIIGRKKWTRIPAGVLFLVVSLVVVMAAAALAGMNPPRSLTQLLGYSKGIVLAILIAGTVKNDAQIQCLTKYCLIGVLGAVCVTYFEHLTGAYVIDADTIQRAGQFTGNPNDTAMLLLLGLPLALYWATHSRSRFYSIANYVLILLIVGAVTLTQARSGFVSLVLLMFLLYIKKPSIKSTALAVAILSAGLILSPAGYWDRMGTLIGLESEHQDRSLQKRGDLARFGADLALENPVLGVGMGNFGRAMIAANPAYREHDENRVAHNMYLEFAVENGIPGGLLFLTLLGLAQLQTLQYDKRNDSENSAYGLGFCVGASLFVLLFSGMFDSSGKVSVLWFFVGLGFAFQLMSQSIVRQRVVSLDPNTSIDY